MSFKLIIDIRGLCLLVPHEGKMHVLIPETAHHAQHMEPHIARITIPPEHIGNGQPRDFEPFDGLRWDLSGLGQGPASPTLPSVVVDVRRFVRPEGIPRRQLIRGNQFRISSHLILGSGACICHGKSADWRVGGERFVWMTNKIRWLIPDVDANQLDWMFEDIGTSTPAPNQPDPLVPNDDGVIYLDLLHAPLDEHENPTVETCDPGASNHFHMFFDVFGQNSSMRPRCESDDVLPEQCFAAGGLSPAFAMSTATAFRRGPSVFTCMLAQAKVDPTS